MSDASVAEASDIALGYYRPPPRAMLRPPRYLLREHVVLGLVDELGARHVAEIGCGAGEILVTLGRRGLRGVGYDPAPEAREHARNRLIDSGTQSFSITDEWPSGPFDAVLLLEVLGYLDDPEATLKRCHAIVRPGGHVIVSFARTGAGYDPKVVAGMRLLGKEEVTNLLEETGFTDVRQHNYGFPLANLLVGVNNAVYRLRLALHGGNLAVGETGLAHTWGALRPFALVSNRVTLAPFFLIQRLLSHTNLGNGYVATAKAAG
jgi:SAM-dependent methyltransferase